MPHGRRGKWQPIHRPIITASSGPPGAPNAIGIRAGFIAGGIVGLLAVVTALFVRGKHTGGPSRDADADTGGRREGAEGMEAGPGAARDGLVPAE